MYACIKRKRSKEQEQMRKEREIFTLSFKDLHSQHEKFPAWLQRRMNVGLGT